MAALRPWADPQDMGVKSFPIIVMHGANWRLIEERGYPQSVRR